MKLGVFAVLFSLLVVAPVMRAQTTTPVPVTNAVTYDDHTRFLAGLTGGMEYSNYFLAINAGLEIPIKHRVELDLGDAYSPIIHVPYTTIFIPLEEHLAQGTGWANAVSGGGILWVGHGVGVRGTVEYSNYSTNIYKGAGYAGGGIVLRKIAWGQPTRFYFGYIQQFNNGIFPDNVHGTETAHLKGGQFTLTTRMATWGPAVVRMVANFQAGHVLTQGNPACDGTFGITGGPNGGPCYRTGAWGGGADGGVIFEFGKHNGNEAF